jgi:chromosome segregation ATPase
MEARRRVAAEAAPDIEWLRETFGLSLRCDVGAEVEPSPGGRSFSQQAVDAVALQLLESAQLARRLDAAEAASPQLAAAENSLADLGERLRQLRERYDALERRTKNQVERADEAERHAGALREQLKEFQQMREREVADASARERALAEELEAATGALDAVTHSLSWRLTRPLRALKAWLSRSG